MAVGQKLHVCLNQCETVATTLRSFALETQDKNAKSLYTQLAETMDNQVVTPLRARVNHAEAEEPSYKVYQQNTSRS